VTAVADARTSALIVSAAQSVMPQIEGMIMALDNDKGKAQVVGFYELQNAEASDVLAAMNDLFSKGSIRQNSSSSSKLQNSVLDKRAQNNTQTSGTTSSSGFGNSTGSRGGGGMGGFGGQ
jgi:hypothetical protein